MSGQPTFIMIDQRIAVTTDCVIFCQNAQGTKVLLVQRKSDPYKGKWALPGGFVETEEPLEEAAKRELQEETGLVIHHLEQLRTYGTPGRDPRGRTLTIAYIGFTQKEEAVKGADDAADARWFDLQELPPLAFDHDQILQDAKRGLDQNQLSK